MTEQKITKRCCHCKEIKQSSEFHKNQIQCKTCQTQYRQSDKGIIANRKAVKKSRKTKNGKATCKRYYIQRIEQIKARRAVNHAIESGKIPHTKTLQCHYCPAQAEQYHHHKGYEPKHWLDIIPACQKCHKKIHKKTA